MITLVCAGLTLAFLAPVTSMREWIEEPRRPVWGPANWLVLLLCSGFAVLLAAAPIITAVSASRTYDAFRVRCETAGGTVLHVWQGGQPYTCHYGRAAPD